MQTPGLSWIPEGRRRVQLLQGHERYPKVMIGLATRAFRSAGLPFVRVPLADGRSHRGDRFQADEPLVQVLELCMRLVAIRLGLVKDPGEVRIPLPVSGLQPRYQGIGQARVRLLGLA